MLIKGLFKCTYIYTIIYTYTLYIYTHTHTHLLYIQIYIYIYTIHIHTYIYTCRNIYIYTNSQLLRIQKVFNKLVLATNYKYLTKAKTSN